jgi:hypothetical protein
MRAGYGGINILKETESEVNIVFGHEEGEEWRELLTKRNTNMPYLESVLCTNCPCVLAEPLLQWLFTSVLVAA